MISLGPFSAFLSSVTWALGASAYTELSRKYPAYTINFARACVASVVFLLLSLQFESGPGATFSALFHQTGSIDYSRFAYLFLSVVGSYGVGDLFFIASAKILGVPAALAIASAYPLWAAFFGFTFNGEPFSVLSASGVLCVVGGVVLVILSGNTRKGPMASTLLDNNKKWLGVVFAVTTSLFWALNTFALNHVGKAVPPFEANFYRMFFAVILCPLIGTAGNVLTGRLQTTRLHLSKVDWLKSIPIFLLEGVGGSYFFLYGVTHSPLAVGAALTSLAPVVSYPIALALRKESPNFRKFLAILTVILGVVLLSLSSDSP